MKRHNRTLDYCPELFYILGAMLGDGCIYRWKNDYQILIVGEEYFTQKCASKLSIITGNSINIHKHAFRNFWWVKISHYDLFMLFEKIRSDLCLLLSYMKLNNYYDNSLAFVEGFFDAEGCVKIIKEPVRITPKICLDITNTNKNFLDIIQRTLSENLDIEARYSIQRAYISKDGILRKASYHLRIYKKEYVRRFLENIPTIKLKEEKKDYVYRWLHREAFALECISV